MNNVIKLVSPTNEIKIANIETDIVLIILTLFGLGWIKLLIDGRINSGLINILLFYTLIGPLIHGLYIALNPEKHVSNLIIKGYRPVDEDDRKLVKISTGLDVECASI